MVASQVVIKSDVARYGEKKDDKVYPFCKNFN